MRGPSVGKPTHVHVKGPLACYAVPFEEDLAEQGYRSARDQLYAMAQLSHWLVSENLGAEDLTAVGVEQFLCWRGTVGYVSSLSLNKMSPLLHYLQGTGVVPTFEPITPMTPVGLLIERYSCYLAEERSLSAPSIRNYTGVARDFLSSLSMNSELDLENMTTARVTEFVLSECRRQKVASAKAMTTRLRSLLRFLYVVGLTSNELAGAVPSVASWRLASLPKAIPPRDVAKMLRSCDRRRATGRRDFAVLLVLSRLGLRAGEVARLKLADIDWRSGQVVVRGKGNREDRLPVPVDVGEAVVVWLRRGRPRCADQSVFTRVRAPHRGLSSEGISAIVWHACERAGLAPVGAHRLRHTAATEMLRAGGSLAEVGQVLRHVARDTTSIYAKVDRRSLVAVVQPWPGGAA